MLEWSHSGFYEWYTEFIHQCYEHRVWALSYHMFHSLYTEDNGFLCCDTTDAHLLSSSAYLETIFISGSIVQLCCWWYRNWSAAAGV